MIYVFTFLGEFGYELFNWQGVIRKFSRTISASDRIVCCSRANLYPLYETAHQYIDISEVEMFRQSIACGYFALHPQDLVLNSAENLAFDRRIKEELRVYILEQLWRRRWPATPTWFGRIFLPIMSKHTFVFSSERVELNGCRFGCDRTRFGVELAEGSIYDLLDLKNNEFKQIVINLDAKESMEKRLGWPLETPFVLCQSRMREIRTRSHALIPKESLVQVLPKNLKVVLLSFKTGRHLDSYSAWETPVNCYSITCNSFAEQACLIHFSRHRIFFTEGDFGSHIYVPPFLGKDVIAIAPRDVYQLGSTPICFWNTNVFRFGGQIIPKISEEVFASEESILKLTDEIIAS